MYVCIYVYIILITTTEIINGSCDHGSAVKPIRQPRYLYRFKQ